MKIVLSMQSPDSVLGEPINFKTLKDTLIFDSICKYYTPSDPSSANMEDDESLEK